MTMQMIEATHKTANAWKTWHVHADRNLVATLDHLSDGRFRSYIGGVKRLHPHLQSALVRIQTEYTTRQLSE